MKLFKLTPLAFLALTFNAHALYYCSCDTGAHASCGASVGSDSNDGSTPSLARLSLPTAFQLENAAAGTTHYFCQGGWWAAVSPFYFQNGNVTRSAPLTLTTYAPASGATGYATFAFLNSSAQAIVTGGFNNPTEHGGYVINGLRITREGSAGGEAISPFGHTRWFTFTNNRVDNWANAVLLSTDQGLRDFVFRGNLINNNSQNAIVGSATDLLIEDNDIEDNNYTGNLLQHAIYNGGCDAQQRITIRRNRLRRNSQTGGSCASGNITARGNVTDLVIEENYIETDAAVATCYGVSVIAGYPACSEHIDGLKIRGNTIANVGSNSIAIQLCTDCLVENNQISRTFTNTGTHVGISFANPSDSADLAVSPVTGATVRNNSIFVSQAGSGSGISLSVGTGHKVLNNSVYLTSGAGTSNCFAHSAISNFSIWDNNWCYELGSGQWSGTYSSLALAQAAGFDTNGGNTDPLLAATPASGNSFSQAVQSGSPLRSAGRNTDKSKFDVLMCLRDSSPDVGAHEYGGTPCLTFRAPAELR